MYGKCDWCGKKGKIVQTGLFVSDDGKERFALMCADESHIDCGNPVFESTRACYVWFKKHKVLARRVVNTGGPAMQYLIEEIKNKGRAW